MSNFQIIDDLEVEVKLPQGLQQTELAQDQLHILPSLKGMKGLNF